MTTATEYKTETTHRVEECAGCADAVRKAVGFMKATGSVSVTHNDNGYHVATVSRAVS